MTPSCPEVWDVCIRLSKCPGRFPGNAGPADMTPGQFNKILRPERSPTPHTAPEKSTTA